MSKTFREVIRDIEVGEVWECSEKEIRMSNIGIVIKYKNEAKLNYMGFVAETLYNLKKQEYTFTEAFTEYEKGVEIESVKTGTKYKKENGLDCWFSKVSLEWSENNDDFSIGEIRNNWYINK